jgi:hypothetical protein
VRAIFNPISYEQSVAYIVAQLGPFVALGAPSLGAARFRTLETTWQVHVQKYLASSQLIIVRVGDTDGLRWELAEVLRMGFLTKLVIMLQFPGVQDKSVLEARYRQFSRWFGPMMRVDLPQSTGKKRFLIFHEGHSELTASLTQALYRLEFNVERAGPRAMLKGMLPSASNRLRSPWKWTIGLSAVLRWLLLISSSFVAMAVSSIALASVTWVGPQGVIGTLILLAAVLAALSGGWIMGRLTSIFDIAGGKALFLLGSIGAVWSYCFFVMAFLKTIDLQVLGIVYENEPSGFILLAVPFLLIPFEIVTYGLSASERRQRG